jgi:hypothetical protein
MSGRGKRPSLIRRGLWQTRRAHYLAVFDRALQLLRLYPELPLAEKSIVRELNFTAVTARRELDPKGKFERPRFEAQNLPDPDSDELESYEEKRPDIQWVHDNPDARDDRYREKSFVIECKRLGRTTRSGWNLNEQYVIGGVHRFRSPLCRYGNHMQEGMMIGFVQDMEMETIHGIVNQQLAAHGIPILSLQGEWAETGITMLNHEFERSFPKSPFLLIHRWLDLRDIPKAPVKPKPKRTPNGSFRKSY